MVGEGDSRKDSLGGDEFDGTLDLFTARQLRHLDSAIVASCSRHLEVVI